MIKAKRAKVEKLRKEAEEAAIRNARLEASIAQKKQALTNLDNSEKILAKTIESLTEEMSDLKTKLDVLTWQEHQLTAEVRIFKSLLDQIVDEYGIVIAPAVASAPDVCVVNHNASNIELPTQLIGEDLPS